MSRLLGLAALAAACGGNARCSSQPAVVDSGGGDGGDAGTAIFPPAFRRTGFQMVRACRAPGEHSALNGFTVWVNDGAAAAYDQILGGGAAGVHQMPDEALVIKELYADANCGVVNRWVVMKKVAGFDVAHGDWFWQDVATTGAVTSEGQVPACSGCHEGRLDGTCAGFGAVNGMDYLCTAP